MKRIILLFLSTAAVHLIWGQDLKPALLSSRDSVIGIFHDTGQPVVPGRYLAPEKIYGWHWNADSGDLLLELRETDRKGCSFKSRGTLHMIDLQTKEEKWSRPINYRVSQVNRQDAYLFLTERKKNYCLDPETGEVLWLCDNSFQFIDPRLRIGVEYPVDSPSDKLYAVDLFRRGSGAILLPMTTFNV